MSRCYPFPPPGYVKSVPVELELSSKKDRHKHKEKKKNRKKHSTTNGDLTGKEGNQHCTNVKQTGQPYEGSQKLPSARANEHIIEAKRDLDTDSETEITLRPRKESRSKSMLPAERFQGDSSRPQPISRCVYGTDSCQMSQAVDPAVKGFVGSCLATSNKRLKSDSSTLLSISAPRGSGYMRPEQGDNSESLNGVLSTKRKRLQAENSVVLADADRLLQKDVSSSDFKKSDALQTGRFRSDELMQDTAENSIVQADYSRNARVSKKRLPTNFGRPEKKPAKNQSRSKPGANEPCSNHGKAGNGNVEEVPDSLLVNKCAFENEEPEMQSNGVKATNCERMQMNSCGFRNLLNGTLMTYCDQSLQSEKFSMMKSRNISSMSDTLAYTVNGVCSSEASMLEESERRVQNTANCFPNVFPNTKNLPLELDCTKNKASAHDVRATSEERVGISRCRQDMTMRDVEAKAKKTCNRHDMLANSYGHSDPRLHVDALNSRVTSNGVVGGNEGSILSTPACAANGNYSKAHNKATHFPRTVALNGEDNILKEKLSNLRIPQLDQAWVISSESEDWLVSSKRLLQSKAVEKGEDADLQQVWADAVLLRAVGLTALPFVVLN